MSNDPIKCEICGQATHAIALHLRDAHKDVTLEQYTARFPNAPLLSDAAKVRIEESKKGSDAAPQQSAPPVLDLHIAPPAAAPVAQGSEQFVPRKETVKALFKVPLANASGDPLSVTAYTPPASLSDMVPDIDPDHFWGDGEDLRNMLMAIETNMPLYVFGHKGTGKTTDIENICALTGRPMIRVQHTRHTEESHIVGQWTMQGGNTVFELGPLAIAMHEGLVYLADEYDVAQPGALAVYQPVLEGKPLVIKEAPRHLRVIRPHPMFRFVGTGNTNGTGDPTGLYAGTMLQNSANYDRFQMSIEKDYMPAEHEAKIIVARTGVKQPDAEKLTKLAKEVRTNYGAGKMSDTVSTRSLVSIATIGRRRANMKLGIQLGWANKLNSQDREVVMGVAQRYWG